MKTRAKVRLMSYIAAAVAIILGAGIVGYNLANTYKTTIQYSYHRSLSQLSDYFSSIKNTLQKGEYANTQPQQYGLASKLMVEAEGAKNALSQLPVSQQDSEGIQKYLTQVSDFSSFCIGMLSRNNTLSDENKEALNKLAEYADKVAPQVEELSAKFIDGTEHIGRLNALQGNLEQTQQGSDKTPFDNSFLTISESFVDYPALIYDGPFSDSVQRKTPKLTENAQGCSVQQAQKAFADFVGKDADDVKYKETRKGNLPVYVFEGDNLYGTVTVKGCYVCEMYYTNTGTDNKYVYKQLLPKAQDFLKRQKIDNMTESYYIIENGVCTINFAYSEKETTCYGDLIKVGVSTQTGTVVSYNAEGYIMNHTQHNLKSMKLSVNQAKNSVSGKLNIVGSKKALIPLSTGKEVQCYEYTCKGKNDETVLVYINGNTGLEEQIFILIENDNGILVV